MSVASSCLRGRLSKEAALARDFVHRETQRCLQLDPEKDGKRLLRLLDDISDRICQVIDTAEFLRVAHASSRVRDDAAAAAQTMNRCIQELNTNKNLYEQLSCLQRVRHQFSPEDRRMTDNLMVDFEDNGIRMSDEVRENVRNLHYSIAELSAEFVRNVANNAALVRLDHTQIEDLPASVRSHLTRINADSSEEGRGPLVPTFSPFREAVLRYAPDSSDRRHFYETALSVPKNLDVLEKMLGERRKLARAAGRPSYAALKMGSGMIRCPDAAEAFLREVAKKVRPAMMADVDRIRDEKRSVEVCDEVGVWDESFYKNRHPPNPTLARAHEYFSVDSVLRGVGTLLRDVFGVEMREIDVISQESWCGDDIGANPSKRGNVALRKFAFNDVASDENASCLGHVYLDPFSRPGKPPGASHYVLEGGRWHEDPAQRQCPVVVISCSFSRPSESSGTVPLCGVWAADTLIHEFGHALHSLSSQTTYQHLSGTRVSTDVVEIPAILLSKFLWDPRSMGLFARHYQTDEPMASDAMSSLIESERSFVALERTHTAMHGVLDLRLHDESQPLDGASTTRLLRSLEEEFFGGALRPSRALWHTQFSHLIHYGGSYYTYLVGEAMANQLWSNHFDGNPLRERSGIEIRQKLLSQGNAKCPRELFADWASIDDATEFLSGCAQ